MSSYHLTDLIQNAAVKMGTLALYKPSPVQTATTTSATIITDTSLSLTADELIHGVAIVSYVDGAGTAPEGEIHSISDNAGGAGTSTITVETGFSAAIKALTEFMIIRPKYPLVEWLRGANSVLKSLGDIPVWDASLTMSSGVTEYTLPVAILEPFELFWQTNDTTLDYEWAPLDGCYIQDAAPGVAKVLRIPNHAIVDGKKIGIKYMGVHPTVHAWNDHIDIPLELVSGKLAWHMINRGGLTDKNNTQAQKILAELNDAERKFRIPNKQGKVSKFFTWPKSA